MLWILAGVSLALLIYEAGTLIAAVLLPLWSNPNVLQTDFHYYYEAATRFRTDAAQLYSASDDVIAGFAYPPPAILPFVGLSYLPLGTAMVVITIASYAATLAAIVLWIRYLNRRGLSVDWRTTTAAVVIAVASGPTYSNAVFGQVNAFVLLCAVVFVTVGPTRPAIAGAALAAGVWLKLYPIVMTAVGLWNRSAWRRIGYAIGAAAVIVFATASIVPVSAYESYVKQVLPARFDKTAVHITNQSLIAFIERFSIPPERFLNWTGEQAMTSHVAVRAFNWLLGVVAIVFLWSRAIRGPRLEAIDSTAALIALAAVIAPLGWGHTYMLMLPLLVLHLVSLREATPATVLLIGLCAAAFMIPAGRRVSLIEELPAWLQNIVYSRYLIATLILIALPPAISKYPEPRR